MKSISAPNPVTLGIVRQIGRELLKKAYIVTPTPEEGAFLSEVLIDDMEAVYATYTLYVLGGSLLSFTWIVVPSAALFFADVVYKMLSYEDGRGLGNSEF